MILQEIQGQQMKERARHTPTYMTDTQEIRLQGTSQWLIQIFLGSH